MVTGNTLDLYEPTCFVFLLEWILVYNVSFFCYHGHWITTHGLDVLGSNTRATEIAPCGK